MDKLKGEQVMGDNTNLMICLFKNILNEVFSPIFLQ